MLRGEGVIRDIVAELIRSAVDETVRKQSLRRAQEPPITSKVAEALESRLDGQFINGYSVTVVAQDFPDRGPGSWEHKSGADLYVGIRVESPWAANSVAKGLLVQAKKADGHRALGSAGAHKTVSSHGQLLDQCAKMFARSPKGSFVWVYGPGGTRVVSASEVIANKIVPPEYLAGRNVAEQFRDVLDCVSGDEQLVAANIFHDDLALGNYLEEIAVQRGVAINLASEGEAWDET